jgi:hypothetical protein
VTGEEEWLSLSFRQKKNKHRCAFGVCPHATPTIFNRTKTMSTKDLIRLGVPVGEPLALAHEFIQNFIAQGSAGVYHEANLTVLTARAAYGSPRIDRVLPIPG